MSKPYKKKLIEVAIPLDAINEAAGRENNIHTGLPSNLHTWWSRKPLGVARATLFASLVDDPSTTSSSQEEESANRERLFSIIEQLADVQSGMNPELLRQAQEEIKRSNGGKLPSFWDPFCGGGALPLEALRLGLAAIGTDLNPVAVFATRVMIDLAPRHAHHRPVNPPDKGLRAISGEVAFEGLKRDVIHYGELIGERLASSMSELYPKAIIKQGSSSSTADIVAWIWARTVECPNPSCRAKAPLVNKFWLSTHKANEAFVHGVYNVEARKFKYEVRTNGSPAAGTVNRNGATCLACSNPISFDHIRSEGLAGRIEYQLMAMAADGPKNRLYLPPDEQNEEIANNCVPSGEPETNLPQSALGFRVQKYGIVRHKDLFTKRQLTALAQLADAIAAIRSELISDADGDESYADLVQAFLALSLSRVAQTNNTLIRWLVRASGTSKGTPAFDRQIVSMVWEFSEGNLLGSSVGSWKAAIKNPLTALNCFPISAATGKAFQADAASDTPCPSGVVISTDPPYFDAIGYADLSDFFYIWLRRAMGSVHPDIFGTLLVPKDGDLTANLGRSDIPRSVATQQFLDKLGLAFQNIYSMASEDVPVTIYYAFKQTDAAPQSDDEKEVEYIASGWETLLESVIGAGFQITGTWPLRTEAASRLRAIGSNALATSILLVCRKRDHAADSITKAEFIRLLKRELPEAITELRSVNISPPDMPQSAVGPGMSIFSRYKAVLERDDKPMTVRGALQLINRELDESLNNVQGEFDAETRFTLTWFEQNGYSTGDYGTANNIATARGISVDAVKHAGIVESGANRVRIFRRDELQADWDPSLDNHLTVWECCQHLVRKLENYGEAEAAALLRKIGSVRAEAVKDLAYCLYDICSNKRKDAKEATSYNALIAVWTELTRQAAAMPMTTGAGQTEMNV